MKVPQSSCDVAVIIIFVIITEILFIFIIIVIVTDIFIFITVYLVIIVILLLFLRAPQQHLLRRLHKPWGWKGALFEMSIKLYSIIFGAPLLIFVFIFCDFGFFVFGLWLLHGIFWKPFFALYKFCIDAHCSETIILPSLIILIIFSPTWIFLHQHVFFSPTWSFLHRQTGWRRHLERLRSKHCHRRIPSLPTVQVRLCLFLFSPWFPTISNISNLHFPFY